MKTVFKLFTFEVVTSVGETERLTFRQRTLSEAEAALMKAAEVRGYEIITARRLRKVRHVAVVR